MTKIGNRQAKPLRFLQLQAGLVLYGVTMAMFVRADLGLDPWDVFHQGVSERTGLRFGLVVIIVGAGALLLWLPLRQRPGIGTVSNVIVVGLAAEGALAVIPTVGPVWARVVLLVAAVTLNGVATASYIGAALGPGPRDGLMTGLAARHPRLSIRLVRTGIEVTVLAIGWLLGGSVGIGTVLYALAIGPLTQAFLPTFSVQYRRPGAAPDVSDPHRPPRPAPVHP